MHRALLCVAAVMVACIATACGGDSGSSAAPERVVGLITEIEPEEGVPTSFTVEEDDGDSFEIEIDPEHDYGFDLLHVRDHFVTEDPVDVAVEDRGGTLVATSIEDVE